MPKEINPRHRLFVEEYLKDFVGAKAAIRAGWSQKSARCKASQLLRREDVRALINDYLYNEEVTKERLVGELKKIAFSDIADFGTVEPGGQFNALAFEDVEIGKTAAIRKIKETKSIISKPDGDDIVNSNVQYELHDKMKALEILAKHLKITDSSPSLNLTIQESPLLKALNPQVGEIWEDDE